MECTVSEGVVKVVFQHYCHGLATALLVNYTVNNAVNYCQKYVAVRLYRCIVVMTAISHVETTLSLPTFSFTY